MSWTEDAACLGPENNALFFPAKGGDTVAARALCKDCPVKQECLDFAIENQIWDGIWGGRSGTERRSLTRGEDIPVSTGHAGRRQQIYTDCLFPDTSLCGTRPGYQKGCHWQDCVTAVREYSQLCRDRAKEREANAEQARDLSHS